MSFPLHFCGIYSLSSGILKIKFKENFSCVIFPSQCIQFAPHKSKQSHLFFWGGGGVPITPHTEHSPPVPTAPLSQSLRGTGSHQHRWRMLRSCDHATGPGFFTEFRRTANHTPPVLRDGRIWTSNRTPAPVFFSPRNKVVN